MTSVVVLIVVIVTMYAIGSRYYIKLRQLLAGNDGEPPVTPGALAAYLDSRDPTSSAVSVRSVWWSWSA